MNLSDIPFADAELKACVLATGCQQAEEVEELRCRGKKIKNLSGIEYLSELKLADFTRNLLTEVDLSANTKLVEVFLGNNEVASLDISGCGELRHLEVFINDLAMLDLSANPLLEEIYASDNDLEVLDLRTNNALEDIRFNGNALRELWLPEAGKLSRVDLADNPLNEQSRSQLADLGAAGAQISV